MKERMTGRAGRGRPAFAAVLLLLGLTACGGSVEDESREDPGWVVGSDWRTTGIVRDSGSITRGGADTDVLVCVNADSADFYLDDEVQTLYGYVSYPILLQGDPWEAFQSIDFADRNGDGDSDVAMVFDDGNGALLMVWFWDADAEEYVFRPEESRVGEDAGSDSGAYQGIRPDGE